MADHLWFIPVTGGGPFSVTPTGTGPLVRPQELNVQYAFKQYPTQQAHISPASPIFGVETRTEFQQGEGASSIEPGKLLNCFARFIWDSCACDSEFEDEITLGGQLNVGTVFGRELPLDNTSSMGTPAQSFVHWTGVEVWTKFRVDEKTRLSEIFLSISDASGNVSSTPVNTSSNDSLIELATNNQWTVGYLQNSTWTSWDNPATNLRVTLSVLGTTNVANIGRVQFDIEWFAFRLRGQVDPT